MTPGTFVNLQTISAICDQSNLQSVGWFSGKSIMVKYTTWYGWLVKCKYKLIDIIILSRANKVGSPTNHLGFRQRKDTGQGSSSLIDIKLKAMVYPGRLLGSPLSKEWLLMLCQPRSDLDKVDLMTDYLKLKNTDRLWTCFTKAGWAWHVTIFWLLTLSAMRNSSKLMTPAPSKSMLSKHSFAVALSTSISHSWSACSNS